MCGITGVFDTRGRRDVDRATLVRMNESQHHRGPDEVGLHVEPGVGLGHRRLSIIDLATGQQPLYNADGSVCIVYNGEVYNYQGLPELTFLKQPVQVGAVTKESVAATKPLLHPGVAVDAHRQRFAELWDARRAANGDGT